MKRRKHTEYRIQKKWRACRTEEAAEITAKRRRILLCTGGDVAELRDVLASALPDAMVSRVSIVHVDFNMSGEAALEILDQIGLADARQAYILGDIDDPRAGTVANLALARRIADFRRIRRSENILPVFVRVDSRAPFEFQRPLFSEGDSADTAQTFTHIVSFSLPEMWARHLLGAPGDTESPSFLPPVPSGGFRRIVIAGLSELGDAMLQEAIRVCHTAEGSRTEIIVVDPDCAVRERFLAARPFLAADELPDIHVEWMENRLESEVVRKRLRASALDESCILSVAVCFGSDDEALEEALSLPEEIYWHRLPSKPKTVRDRYRGVGPTIWVRQNSSGGPAEAVRSNPRYSNVRPFGMPDGGFFPGILRESSAMNLNAAYAWPTGEQLTATTKDNPQMSDRIGDFSRKWSDALTRPNGVFDIPAAERVSLLADVLDGSCEAVRRFREIAFRAWLRLPPHLRRANVYVPDGWGLFLRFLNLESVPCGDNVSPPVADNVAAFREALSSISAGDGLAAMEHRRWMADRALLGYRAPCKGSGEVRDDEFLYHPDMVPYSALSSADAGKDDMSLLSIPILLALEGVRLENAANHDK